MSTSRQHRLRFFRPKLPTLADTQNRETATQKFYVYFCNITVRYVHKLQRTHRTEKLRCRLLCNILHSKICRLLCNILVRFVHKLRHIDKVIVVIDTRFFLVFSCNIPIYNISTQLNNSRRSLLSTLSVNIFRLMLSNSVSQAHTSAA